MRKSLAFTLIELLVVVTIIVVLLALLVPAMDKAIYQAELAVCGANIKTSVQGVYTYAMAHARGYPHRAYQGQYGGGVELMKVGDNPLWDLRPMLRPYLPMKALLDPFSGGIDYDTIHNDSNIQCNYALWFDYYGVAGSARMSRVGSRFQWDGRSFDVLISDFDLLVPVSPAGFNGHPDEWGVLAYVKAENATEYGLPDPIAGSQQRKWSFSRWQKWDGTGIWQRGPVDQHFGYQDGSVRRMDRVFNGEVGVSEEERMARVPPRNNGETAQYWSHLPLEK